MVKTSLTLFVSVALLLIASRNVYAINDTAKSFTVSHKGEPQLVYYDLIVPFDAEGKLPVLICVGGLPIIDGQYVHSDTRECFGKAWIDFAEKNKMIILGVGFLFKDRDWTDQSSYQFPAAWSGEALHGLLEDLANEYPLDKDNVYLFGISAGAQFVTRYAFMYPQEVKAVAAHAAGGYDDPQATIPTKFLITVGELDNDEITRVEWAKFFTTKATAKGISVQLEIVPGIAHRQSEEQNELSRKFFEGWLQ